MNCLGREAALRRRYRARAALVVLVWLEA